MRIHAQAPAAPLGAPGDPALAQAVRDVPLLRDAPAELLDAMLARGWFERVVVPRDTLVEAPPALASPLCFVVSGQLSIGVFSPAALAERSRPQRDAALGEADGTLMPPGPLARVAQKNLALFGEGELFNLHAVASAGSDGDRICVFSVSRVSAVLVSSDAIDYLASAAPQAGAALASALALTNARLRSLTGIKHELLDFYVRNGLSVAGPMVRLRQLDLCIDCKQCEDACEDRHGSRRLTLGGYELGLLDFVFTCRTCSDARCLSPCEHDAIKRDASTGEIVIHEDRCIGCSLCALSCPYGAINMVNVAEPELPTFNAQFKARLDKGGKLAFGQGKGRKALARRIANKCDHCAGYGDQACVSACPTGALVEISPPALFRERPEPTVGKRGKRLDILPEAPFVEGLAIRDSGIARVKTRKLSRFLWILGLGSFLAVLVEVALRWLAPARSVSYQLLLDELPPELAEMNVSYLAGSKLALTCGYVGTALMTLSMAYLIQRRFGWFKRTATNQFWLDVHIMTGVVGPLFILLHSALNLTTWVAIPFWSMVAVVLSGLLGRYLYTFVPSLSNRHDLAILAHRRAITELCADHPAAGDRAYAIMEQEANRSARAWEIGLLTVLPWILFDDLRRMWSRRRDRRTLREVAPRKLARRIAARIDRVVFFERRKELAPRGRALLKSWKMVHIPFSVLLLVTMLLHIGYALKLI